VKRRLAACLAFLAFASTAAAPEPVVTVVYRCHHFIASGEGGGAAITLDKSFGEDGKLLRRSVLLEDYGGSVVAGGSTQSATASMRWPGEHRSGGDEAILDWSDGSIKIAAFPKDAKAARPRKGEIWSQWIVDRGRSLTSFESGGDRFAFLNGFDLYLTGTLQPAAYVPMLTMSLDSLLAWGKDLPHLAVYHTLMKGRVFRRRDSGPPLVARRISYAFDIDLGRVRALAELARSRFEAWEAGITDFRKQCERTEETEGDIILT
jgi:hypothetical protein